MKFLVCLAACIYAVMGDGGHSTETHGGYVNLKTAYKGCYSVGQYLPHPSDECMYLRCDYGNEPWKDNYGNIQLFAREMRCANGLSPGYGYKGGYDNPCQTLNKKCFVAPKYEKKTYKKVEHKPVYEKKTYNTGYDAPSYDDKKGYDNTGYDAPTYDKKGYDNTGYDAPSYDDKKGYDNTGYDSYGYDKKDSYDSYDQGYDKKDGYGDKKTTYEQHSYGYNQRQGYNRY